MEGPGVGFHLDLGAAEGFTFHRDPSGGAVREINLLGLGPKMLVSDLSTSQARVLRWRLRVLGNTAVEFGAVPANLQLAVCTLQERSEALHKCLKETGNAFCVGFCAQITVGSQLPFRVPVVKGTVVELLVQTGKAQFTVENPTDTWEARWENKHRIHTEYRAFLHPKISVPDTLDSLHYDQY
eukprot:evm.model.scf_295.2 EVM.evm.TU.scf_295.2   scf_295:15221-17402(+)